MNQIKNLFAVMEKILLNILKFICLVDFTVLTILISANVILRFLSKINITISMHWFDEIVELSFASMIFLGAGALWITDEHFKLDYFKDKIKNPKYKIILNILIEIISLIFVLFFTFYSLRLTLSVTDWSNMFRIPKKLFYMSMPAGGFIMLIYSIKRIIIFIKDLIIPSE